MILIDKSRDHQITWNLLKNVDFSTNGSKVIMLIHGANEMLIFSLGSSIL